MVDDNGPKAPKAGFLLRLRVTKIEKDIDSCGRLQPDLHDIVKRSVNSRFESCLLYIGFVGQVINKQLRDAFKAGDYHPACLGITGRLNH